MSELTLDEAIKHCLEVAEQEEWFINYPHSDIVLDDLNIESRKRFVAEHRQLAEWLTELKELKNSIGAVKLKDMKEAVKLLQELNTENDQIRSQLAYAKGLLKLAVEQMAGVGAVCDCVCSKNCPLDECGKFTFHDEIIKLIES